jgi:antitoxin MazE6
MTEPEGELCTTGTTIPSQAVPRSSGCSSRTLELYSSMKTAISLPDDLFHLADKLAERLHVSRSQLYATAVAEYLAKHQARKVTDQLNAVYANQDSRLEPRLRTLQARSVPRDAW